MTSPRTPNRTVLLIAITVMCLIWGSTWLVIREGLEDLPPFTSAGARFIIAAALLFAIAPLLRKGEGGRKPPTWLWVQMGITNFFVVYGIVYWVEQTLPSGLVSLLWAVFPLFMAASGHWFLDGERLGVRQWMGFVVGFVGIVFLFQTDLRSMGPGAAFNGAILLLSPLGAAIGTTLVKKYGHDVSSSLLNRNGMALAAVLLVLVALVFERGAPMAWTPRAIGSVAYLSVMGTVATFSLYFWLLRHAPAHRMSLVAYVTPGVALVLGWSVGGEKITVSTLVGAGLILVGVMLVVVTKRR